MDGESREHQHEWPDEIGAALRKHGLPSQDVLVNALTFAEAERRTCTENDPGILKGMLGWGRGIRSLREQLRTSNWRREEPNSLPLVVSPDGRIAITIAAGDENTGRAGTPFARTKWDKGKMLVEWVAPTRQMSVFDFEPAAQEPRPELWILLVQRTETDVLAELSRPTSVTESGCLRFGGERIFLAPISLAQEVAFDVEDDETPALDVPVERI